VDPSFGTGAVKVTPAHDPNDFEIARRAGLPLMNVLEADATLNDAVPEAFRGLDRYAARAAVRDALEARGLLVREERPYLHAVGHCYRCRTEIEPWLAGLQWFVKVSGLTGAAKEAVLDGRVRFSPDRWQRPFVNWLDNLRDWNISRQLWWGHRIPAWYCPDGHVTVGVEDPSACGECGAGELTQDPDVLDTWFSSQLWPYSTLGWPDATPELSAFYPNEALVTGYEILYLWVARMVMSGLFLMGDVPFRHAVIHGLVRDGQGRKMSKSLGNVIDPIEMIDRYGADALRFALSRTATGGQQDIPLSEEAIEAGRNFANKIWNAARLVLRGAPDVASGEPQLPPADRLTVTERWLLSRHEACRTEVDAALDEYRFADAAQALQRFTWSELCDWGLELEKGRLEGTQGEAADAGAVLAWVLERTLRLLHPSMPFVTEEIWQRFGVGESVAVATWPAPRPEQRDAGAEASLATVQEVVTAIRQFRAQHHLQGSQKLAVTVGVPDAEHAALGELSPRIGRMTGLASMTVIPGDSPKAEGTVRIVIPGGFVEIPFAGTVDLEAERSRLSKRLGDLDRDLGRAGAKLANEGFRAKAAPEVVAAEQDKVTRLTAERDQVFAQLGELG
jgi:valyl-tRNA synthetase